MEDREKVQTFAVILAEQLQVAKPGEWAVVGGSPIQLVAKRKAHWINKNFGCATRIKEDRVGTAWYIEAQKSKKQPYNKE
jgi:hypothetical protein